MTGGRVFEIAGPMHDGIDSDSRCSVQGRRSGLAVQCDLLCVGEIRPDAGSTLCEVVVDQEGRLLGERGNCEKHQQEREG